MTWRTHAQQVMADSRYSPDDGVNALYWDRVFCTIEEIEHPHHRRPTRRQQGDGR
jgi:hypothetical protein